MRGRDPYRRRGWRNRRRGYPVMMYGPDEQPGMLAATAFARWCYRHRSAFLPFGITAGAFIIAALAHHSHALWWIPVAVFTAVISVVLGVPHDVLRRHPAGRTMAAVLNRGWCGCGIDRGIERMYVTVVIAVLGGWLSAAIAAGPAVKPLPLIAAVATVILGIPWWFHRRRRGRVKMETTIDAWPSIADDIGLPGSHIASAVVDVWGWTARVILRKGTTASQAIEKIPAIESGLGLPPGSARVLPDSQRADRVILRVIETDPHAAPIPWPGPVITSITQPAELGLFEDGQPARVLLVRRNVLVGGTTGSGKSGVVNVILAILAACADVVIWGVDLKGGMELQPWAECLDRLATTPEQAITLFQDGIAELNRRAREQAGQRSRVWEPSRAHPALVIVVDEYAEMPAEAQECADSIARRGRAVAVNLLAATQRPTQEAMGNGAVRSQMDVRICLRVRERRDVDLILGQGSFSSGWHAHTITAPGVFLISAPEHIRPERALAYLVDDDRVRRHAAQHAAGRPFLHAGRPQYAPQEPGSPQTADQGTTGTEMPHAPETALWRALRSAPPEGVPITALMAACGMSRSWVYYRLQEHSDAGRATQPRRGHWRATPTGPDDGRPPSRPGPSGPGRMPRRRSRRRPPSGHDA